jgi:4-hydroxy-4-methyl-2-oxoglutarate aldolase
MSMRRASRSDIRHPASSIRHPASSIRHPASSIRHPTVLAGAALIVGLLASAPTGAQMFTLTKEQLIEITAQNPFERFPDGRPKVPDALVDRVRQLSAEDIWVVLPRKGYQNQYEDGWQILHPGTKLVGRAVTAQFMPMRPDVDEPMQAKAKAAGLGRLSNQFVIDMLQPGDVLVVDLFGKQEGGTIVGDNLFYYIMKTTKSAGVVIDGAIRDLEGITGMPMPAYFRHAHPTPISNVMLTGVNIPVRIGNVTVLPGDLVFGDREGLYFVPPAFVQEVVDRADETRIHDEWTKMKFDEGRYRSSEIYGSPRDPALKQEYQEYLARRLKEIRGQ